MKHRPHLSTIGLILSLPLWRGACAAMHDATTGALASRAPALAIVGERVLTGDVLLYTDRSATVQLHGEGEPALSCMGRMHYTSSTGGTVSLNCSDGSQAQLPYLALSGTSGQGRSLAGSPSVSLTYGLEPEAARAWLIAPEGKRLVVKDSRLRLE